MVLKGRSNPLQIQTVHLVHIIDCMGISHVDSYKPVFLPVYRDILRQPGCEGCFPHVHGNGHCLSILNFQLQRLDPCQCLHCDGPFILIRQTMVVNVFSHAAHTVAAHDSLGPVRVVHLHSAVRCPGGAYENQSVGPDAEMAVAHIDGCLCRLPHRLLKTVHIHIIITCSLHFCKFHIRLHPAVLPAF